MKRHIAIDLPSEFDKAGRKTVFSCFPSEIERVDRDAVSTQAGSGVKRHEAERLGLGRVNDFPDIYPHFGIDHLELVDHRDIDGSENVLCQFDRLGNFR